MRIGLWLFALVVIIGVSTLLRAVYDALGGDE
jgi:hypothetical protein